MIRERISLIFYLSTMFLSFQMVFSLFITVVVWAILERIFGLDPSSDTHTHIWHTSCIHNGQKWLLNRRCLQPIPQSPLVVLSLLFLQNGHFAGSLRGAKKSVTYPDQAVTLTFYCKATGSNHIKFSGSVSLGKTLYPNFLILPRCKWVPDFGWERYVKIV